MRNLTKKILTSVFVITLMGAMAYPVFASGPRDHDSNAIIYGGAYSLDELRGKLANGSGPNPAAGVYGNYQHPGGVREFYNGIGIHENQWDYHIKEGFVTNINTVVVDGNTIAASVFSSGRESIGASIRDTRFPYPIYWRHPQYSMRGPNLPAFVYVNDDGSFGYAIIKSCGNPVLNTERQVHIKKPTPTPDPRYKVTIRKFNDLNEDGDQDSGEGFMSGWEFTLESDNFAISGVTDSEGRIVFSNLRNGTYALKEVISEDSIWRNITPSPISVNVNGGDVTVWFGNKEKTKIKEKEEKEKEIIERVITRTEIVESDQAVKGASTLPQAGAAETAMAFSATSLGTVAYYWRRSKKILMSALKK